MAVKPVLPTVPILVVAILACFVSPAHAQGQAEPWWHLTSASRPTDLAPEGSGEIVVTAENVGDANVNGASAPAQIMDALPAGFKAVGVAGAEPLGGTPTSIPCALITQSLVSCELTGTLVPYAELEVRIAVVIEGASNGEINEVSATGGGAPDARAQRPLAIGAKPAPFGVETYELTNEEAGGLSDAQAGSHPFQQTTTIALNQTADAAPLSSKPLVTPTALPKDLSFKWPAGMIGNATRFPQCTTVQFYSTVEGKENHCPPRTAVGVISLTVFEPAIVGFATYTLPLFNVEPSVGEPARFGFYAIQANAPAFINTSARAGGDYGVTVSINNITQTAAFLSSNVTLWGTPGDPRHDSQRGWGCLLEAREEEHSPCGLSAEQRPPPLLSLPTSCTGSLPSTVLGDSWAHPLPVGAFPTLASSWLPALGGCDRLPFSPQIKVTADQRETSKPTGLTVDIHVPQESDNGTEGLTTSNLENLRVTLPEGVTLNPAVADDLEACSEAQVGLDNAEQPSCPDASKLGTVKIQTPISANPLEGAVYLATQNANPFGSLLAMYIVANDPVSGALVKLAGVVSLGQQTGQITVSFTNAPQIPLEHIELHFFDGERALLATPARCGAYTTDATLTPWSGNPSAEPSSIFPIATGVNGAACPGVSLPFTPSLTGGTTDVQAGGFSPLTATVSRGDGQQSLQSFELHLPPGLSGMLSAVPLCGEGQANAGTCPVASQIGETTVSAGLGGDPYTLSGGKVYLTGSYEGAPFGLSIVTPVKAGPLDLENAAENHPPCDCLVIRAKIEVDPQTAQLTIATHAIPHIIDGVPLQIKHLNITIDRPGFIFNSTNCSPLAITSTVSSDEGASASPSAPFRVASCASLKFSPKLTALTRANGEFAGHGASLHVVITTPQGQANMRSLKVDLPQRLPARLETIQRACPERIFNASPASCPKASVVGSAIVQTPILATSMAGPAILVSHGAAFPNLVLVLKAQGVTIDLTGAVYVDARNVTSVTFRAIPDVPIRRLDLVLPEGSRSIFAASSGLCTKKRLTMLTAINGQNGARVKPTVKVAVEGCKKPKKKRHPKRKPHPARRKG